MKRNQIQPPVGALLRDAEGEVFVLRALHDDPTQVVAQLYGQRSGAVSRPLAGLRHAYAAGMHVQHRPAYGASLGTGAVVATRTMAGFDQILVQLSETGESQWFDWRMLAQATAVEQRIARRMTGEHADHAERARLRILARALKIWNANTGAFGRLDIDPLPHQLDVARKVVTSPQARWLIADDVGLGKTIEVGLILHALTQRNRCRRVLVVCPSSLTGQWKLEMREKFGRHFEIYQRDFRPEYADEMRLRDNVVISLDLAKRDEHAAMLLAAGQWDVIVFDEAHRLGRSESGEQTERYALAQKLRDRTHALLLLTATPHQGKTRRFGALLELVRPDLTRKIRTLEMNPEIVGDIIIRNRKSRVTDAEGRLIFRGHDTQRHMIRPSPEMEAASQALNRYLSEGYRASDDARDRTIGRAIGFVMATYRKLASSSLAAIERALERRLDRLQGAIGGAAIRDLPSEEEREGDDDLAEGPVLAAVPAFFADEPDHVRTVLALIRRAKAADRKLDTFLESVAARLVDKDQNLLVFTEYRATQDYLAAALARRFPGIGISRINGSMSLDEKTANVRAFNQRETRVMISTEAGGEGLNLQRACHVMVNYDLPWNPSRLVQRIGRLYRYGQEKRVQVINLQSDDGFDNAALSLMLDRVTTIAQDMAVVAGEMKEALAAEILGELMSNIDMESLLERATLMKFTQTEADIAEAIRQAQEASRAEAEILQFAASHQTRVSGGFDSGHMVSFVRGMLPHVGAELRDTLHGGKTLEIQIRDEDLLRWPEFGRRKVVRLTADHDRANTDPQLVPMDFEAGFVRSLAELAESRLGFDGLYGEAVVAQPGDSVLSVHQIRWQGLSGDLLEEDLLPLVSNADGVGEMDRNAFAEVLRSPQAAAAPGAPTPRDQLVAKQLPTGVEHSLIRRADDQVMPSLAFTYAALRFCGAPGPAGSEAAAADA